jgi:putative FmdB family regulatory protein
MPIYEYECASCGRRVEVIHGIHSPGPTTCDACGGQLRKVLSAPAIVFKGSGWAKKDARSSAPAKTTGSTDSGDAAAKPSGDAGSDASKPSGGEATSSGSAASTGPASTSGGGSAGAAGD